MFTSLKYVLEKTSEIFYRIYCIAKYELLADMRDSKFGIFWNFASPAIQVLTYWLIFGLAWNRKPIGDIAYLPGLSSATLPGGLSSPVFRAGAALYFQNRRYYKNEISGKYSSRNDLRQRIFNHLCMLLIAFITIFICGFGPNIYWLGLIYYAVCAFAFVEGFSSSHRFIMLWRDVCKLVTSLIRIAYVLSLRYLGMSVSGHRSFP